MNKRKHLLCFFLVFFVLTACADEKEKQDLSKREIEHTTSEPTTTPESKATEAPTKAPQPVLLGSAQTKLLDKSDSRLHNIRLAIKKLNGYRLSPGAEFSFNRIVGPRTAEQGYQDAAVIVQEEKQTGCGGGVCQVSTTMYQVAKRAGLKITERNNHSGAVGYAEKGNDAAVDYGHLDMKFINQTNSTIKIFVSLNSEGIYAEIYRMP